MHERSAAWVAAIELMSQTENVSSRDVVISLGPGIEQDVVEEVWKQAVEGTEFQQSPVRWKHAADLLRCFDCAGTYLGDKLDLCPVCGGIGLVVKAAPDVMMELGERR